MSLHDLMDMYEDEEDKQIEAKQKSIMEEKLKKERKTQSLN